MILENDLIRLTLEPAQGARIRELRDALAGLLLAEGSDADRATKAGLSAEFDGQPFETLSVAHDPAESSATCAARSRDGVLKLTQTIELKTGERGYRVTETVENCGAADREILWGQRAAFSAPFLDGACRIETPAVSYFDPREEPILRMRWPHLADGTDLSGSRCQTGEARTIYLADFAEGQCRVVNPKKNLAVELSWDAQIFPYCWLEERAGSLTLLPHTGMPNAMQEGHGTLTLPAGGKTTGTLTVKITFAELAY